MGVTLSSDKYSLEIAEVTSSDNIPVCCTLGDYEYLLSDDPGIYLFKQKNEQKWLLYEGILTNILIKMGRLYLVPFLDINNQLLEESSLEFNNFFDICNYIRKNMKNSILNVKLLEYSRQNIKTNYLEKIDKESNISN